MGTVLKCLIITVFIWILISEGNTNAQTADSISIEALFSKPSQMELIMKSRQMIIDAVVGGERTKIKEALYYTIGNFDNDKYLSLYPREKWLIAYLIGDFTIITADILNFDTVQIRQYQMKVKPSEDQLWTVLQQNAQVREDEIIGAIENDPKLEAQDKGVLKLEFYICTGYLSKRENQNVTQDELNKRATLFLKENPGTKYELYVRNFVRYEFEPGGLIFAFEWGSGFMALAGQTSSTFKSSGIMDFGMVLDYNRFVCSVLMTVAFSEVKKDFLADNVDWRTGEDAQIFMGRMLLGYNIIQKPKFMLTPLVGIAGINFSPPEVDKKDDERLNNIDINANAAPVFGVECQYRFYGNTGYNYFYNKLTSGYFSLVLRYEFIPMGFGNGFSSLNGQGHCISLALQMGFGGAKRKF